MPFTSWDKEALFEEEKNRRIIFQHILIRNSVCTEDTVAVRLLYSNVFLDAQSNVYHEP